MENSQRGWLSFSTLPGFSSAGFSLLPEGHSKGRERQQLKTAFNPEVDCSMVSADPHPTRSHSTASEKEFGGEAPGNGAGPCRCSQGSPRCKILTLGSQVSE